jgi:hypothetical protein
MIGTSIPVGGQSGLGDYLRLDGYMTVGGYMTAPADTSLGHDAEDMSYEPPTYLGGRLVSAVVSYFLARKFGKKGAKGHTNALVWGAVGGVVNPLALVGRFFN